MRLLVSPHNDDETLFAFFTVLRYQPTVLVVTDSHIQQQRGHDVTADQRRRETLAAMAIAGVPVEFAGLFDDRITSGIVERALRLYSAATEVWIPAVEDGGHPHHNLIGSVAASIWPNATRYMTYTASGKSTGREVQADGSMILRKLKALACYESQITNHALGCWQHFLGDQHEYYAV